MNTKDNNRLAIRIVFSKLSEAQIRKVLDEIKEMISSIGVFYDLSINPYPKFPESSLAHMSFDVPPLTIEVIEQIVQLFGGSGWHFHGERQEEREAIWAKGEEHDIPINKFVIWVQVQLIPFGALASSRKAKAKR